MNKFGYIHQKMQNNSGFNRISLLYKSILWLVWQLRDLQYTILFPGHQYSTESSDLMGDTRARNMVFKPRSAEQWLAMFGPG